MNPNSPEPSPSTPLKVLLVDDEPLARQRLRTLLGDCQNPTAQVVAEAGDAVAAMSALTTGAAKGCDLVLLDIQLPGASGLKLADSLRGGAQPPAVVFVTAHAEHAVQAFELEAVDYLTKPVRLERLQASLQKVKRYLSANQAIDAKNGSNSEGSTGVNGMADAILIHDRGRTERVPLTEVLYLKAELKYVTVRTANRTLIYDGSLAEFEERHGNHWLRIHRNTLVARHAIRTLEKHHDPNEGGDCWAVRLTGVPEFLVVSRRQLAMVRSSLGR